jgi:transcriptional regulator GlxA family with amidase domain
MSGHAVTIVLFDGFEPLDVFGPLELLGLTPGLSVNLVASIPGPVASAQGARVIATAGYDDVRSVDVLLVPGGPGTRALVEDRTFLTWLAHVGGDARLVTSVCTGAALLAASGLLDGHRATTNKAAFSWVTQFGREVDWIAEARWVHDRTRWTSAGVAAGMDMTAALIADLCGEDVARRTLLMAELEATESSLDPFARAHGLIEGTTGGR